MIFDRFEQIRVVNLRERSDRRRQMRRQLALAGLARDPRVTFFSALSFDDPGPFKRKGSHGAFMSHLSILREAAEANESVLILQDDCDFLFPQVRTYEAPDFDIFYGGFIASNPSCPEASDIVGAHFMGFSAHAAREASAYLAAYLRPDFRVDEIASAQPGFRPEIRPPIDGAFVWFRRAHPELRTVFAQLGVQRSSRTDIGDQKWFDRVPVLRGLASLARPHMTSLANWRVDRS